MRRHKSVEELLRRVSSNEERPGRERLEFEATHLLLEAFGYALALQNEELPAKVEEQFLLDKARTTAFLLSNLYLGK